MRIRLRYDQDDAFKKNNLKPRQRQENFEDFRNRDFAIPELKRRFTYKVGNLSYLQAEYFEYFTIQWSGCHYCLVSTCHKAVKQELL